MVSIRAAIATDEINLASTLRNEHAKDAFLTMSPTQTTEMDLLCRQFSKQAQRQVLREIFQTRIYRTRTKQRCNAKPVCCGTIEAS